MLGFAPHYFVLQVWALIILGGLIWWMPTLFALSRGSGSVFGIAILNFLAGWTLIWLGLRSCVGFEFCLRI